ncbi:hypothetical protein CPB86DRAFT_746879 [Serendipita vermifera]|nr:hypothetical protein CPB86DRAFT_746879 [Serendipita vermifera]
MATSMAAALAATLPAPTSAAPSTIKPTYEAIPPSMSKIIDVQAEIPITSVQIDAMVVSKIIKHGRETTSGTGTLLGLDFDGTMEISNSFPLPAFPEEEDKSAKTTAQANYQNRMISYLKEVQGDENIVGFYQTTSMPMRQSLVELQAFDSERRRQGGIIIVHDPLQASRGVASFKAYRLTPQFSAAYKQKKFTTQSLIEHRLTFSSIFEELPIRIHTSALASAFINLSAAPKPPTALQSYAARSRLSLPAPHSSLPPDFSHLDLGIPTSLTRNLEQVVEGLDNYRTEENNVAYLSRQIAREKARADAYLANRKEENARRAAQDLPPLPEEDVSRLFKVPPEPSRLESMLLLGQIDALAKNLEESTSTGLVRIYAAQTPS